jgi:hypothetical protein
LAGYTADVDARVYFKAALLRSGESAEGDVMELFDIYFLGEMLPGVEPDRVRDEVARLFSADDATLDRLFSGEPVRVKHGVDADRAGRYRHAFRKAGALVEIVPAGSPRPAPRTRSTREPALAVVATDASLSLAEPGAIIDETPPAPPARFETSHLEALPPNSGSLSDCRAEKPARPIPDISHLSLVDE